MSNGTEIFFNRSKGKINPALIMRDAAAAKTAGTNRCSRRTRGAIERNTPRGSGPCRRARHLRGGCRPCPPGENRSFWRLFPYSRDDQRHTYKFRKAPGSHFRHDTGAMGFDSRHADAEFTSNDLVLLAIEQPCQHLVFPRGQFCESFLDYSRFGMARMFVAAANQSPANGSE